ncbi:hydroxyacylglutathione hydrolase [Shewanella mesophila]|uniref:hydroxyacylglutathione hydrolase n=1 Tax=Shewanella mesophila TaxID=2864208 RepID=UPI001C6549A1|nr:hydroxyacylglutathione hydrolase [Shewanella mesophila]QYJ84627.1 hydroxyacylglutathione hydrolase [Shewanella mesophila]
MISISPIAAFNDNYIWLISDAHNKQHYVVDPGDSNVVITYLKQHNIELSGILITHHHHDHTGGILGLQAHSGHKLHVYGPDDENIEGITHSISAQMDSITLPLLPTPIKVFHLPGHTLGHIAYLIDGHLFCGDTLFSAGCGRLFEGTPTQMLRSLNRLSELDDDTLVYPAHEYTLANLSFALHVEPANKALQQYHQKAMQLRTEEQPTLPTTLALEKAINPFLRANSADIQQNLSTHFQQPISDEQTCFTLLRQWKDNF